MNEGGQVALTFCYSGKSLIFSTDSPKESVTIITPFSPPNIHCLDSMS